MPLPTRSIDIDQEIPASSIPCRGRACPAQGDSVIWSGSAQASPSFIPLPGTSTNTEDRRVPPHREQVSGRTDSRWHPEQEQGRPHQLLHYPPIVWASGGICSDELRGSPPYSPGSPPAAPSDSFRS